MTLTNVTQSLSWVGPSLLDGFTVPWIHHGTENSTYFMHTLLCSHTLNCNRFNHIKSPIFSLIDRGAVYIRVARMRDTLTQQTKQFGRRKFTLRVRQVKSWDRDIRDPRTCATRYLLHLARDFKTPEFRRNCRATYGIVTRGPIHSCWK